MPAPKIEDLRFSSSSIDDFFAHKPIVRKASQTGPSGKIRIASVHQLAGFQLVAEDQLVHLSQQDFWHLGKDKEGYFIERLVDDDQGPVVG
jgi:hypothetical protein